MAADIPQQISKVWDEGVRPLYEESAAHRRATSMA